VCEQGEHVSRIRVHFEYQDAHTFGSRLWLGAGKTCSIRHIPGRCSVTLTTGAGGRYRYRATLSYTAGRGKERAQKFVDDTTPMDISWEGFKVSISDGTTQSEVYFGGPMRGKMVCLNSAPKIYAQFCAHNEDGGATARFGAVLNGRLPPGDALWLSYTPATPNDPAYKQCDKAIYQKFGDCVLAVGKEDRTGYTLASATVAFPAESDAHGSEVAAKVVGPQGLVAAASLSIQLCQMNGNPPMKVCG
jgi:hypothetical protein